MKRVLGCYTGWEVLFYTVVLALRQRVLYSDIWEFYIFGHLCVKYHIFKILVMLWKLNIELLLTEFVCKWENYQLFDYL